MRCASQQQALRLLVLLLATQAARAQLSVQGLTVTTSSLSTGYNWALTKTFSGGADTLALTVPVGGSATASYTITATRTLTTQQARLAGTFTVAGSGADDTFVQPTVSLPSAPAGSQTVVPTCSSSGTLPRSCTFSTSWSAASDATAATAGVVRVTLPGATPAAAPAEANYNFASGGNTVATSDCAYITDVFASGDITDAGTPDMIAFDGGQRPPSSGSGVRTCEATTTYQYVVTFSNMKASWCSSPKTAINTATLTSGAQTLSDTATATLSVSGCVGGAVSVSSVKTLTVQTYSWALTKAGGGSGLTTTPDAELSIPFTITATQTLQSTVGYVSGTVTVTNTVGGTLSITGLTVTLQGQQAQTVSIAGCSGGTTLASTGASTGCAFNVSDTAAPSAGSVVATVTYTADGAGGSQTATSSSVTYDYSSATSYQIGGTASIYDVVDTRSLSPQTTTTTTTGTVTSTSTASSYVRFDPADNRPPGTSPGLSLSGSRTFTYNMIISKMYQCLTSRTVTNTVTLTPSGGSTQGQLTASASAEFSVVGCNVLPTVGLSNVQTWAAVTWSWAATKVATPSTYQLPVGQGATANYELRMTRTRNTGNYFLSGNLQLNNPATYPMYISSVTLVSTNGQFGSLPPACSAGNVGGSTISTGVTANDGSFVDAYGRTTYGVGGMGQTSNVGSPGAFVLAAGAQINCQFNVSAGTGSPTNGILYAQATTTGTYVAATGNTAISQNVPVNFAQPSQQWDIGGCVLVTDTATVTGGAGAWLPSLGGLPTTEQVCEARTLTYGAAISPVPPTGAICNQPVTVTNNAVLTPVGGGTAVTATSQIQVVATGCSSPSPSPNPSAPPPPPPPPAAPAASLSDAGLLTVAVMPGVAATGVAPGLAGAGASAPSWTLAVLSDVPAGHLTMSYNEMRNVTYTVTAAPAAPAAAATTGSYFVAGSIRVSNTQTGPVNVTAVVAQFGAIAQPSPASCPSPLPLTLPAGGAVLCGFNASVPAPLAGTVTASASSSAGWSTSASGVPYAFDSALVAAANASALAAGGTLGTAAAAAPAAADGGGAGGSSVFSSSALTAAAAGAAGAQACAVVTDQLSAPPSLAAGDASGSPAPIAVSGGHPPGSGLRACEGTSYTVTVSLGPFDDDQCNLYSLPLAVAAAPEDGSQAAATTAVLQLELTGCPLSTASVQTVTVELSGAPTVTSAARTVWRAATAPETFRTVVKYGEAVPEVRFNLALERVVEAASTLSGAVTVTNPTPKALTLAGVSVLPELSGSGAALGAGAIAAVNAVCDGSALAANGGSATCRYEVRVPAGSGGGSGSVVATATLGNGRSVDSSAATFTLAQGAAADPAADDGGADACAEVIPGLFLSSALTLPGQQAPAKAAAQRVCEGRNETLVLALAPFAETECGKYGIASTTRVRPTSGRQAAFASTGAAILEVTGCPLTLTPKPIVVVGEGLAAGEVTAYKWSVSKTSNATDPLTVPYDAPVVVAVTATATRGAGSRSAALNGTVQLQAQGRSAVTVSRVQAATLQRLGEVVAVDARCPPDAVTDGGLISIPPPPAKLACAFSVGGLPPMGGAVMALVTSAGADKGALPTTPALFALDGGPAARSVVGDCAQLGASRSLTKAGAVGALADMPAIGGQPFAAGAVCNSSTTGYTLTFGPFAKDACGRYAFVSDLSADAGAAGAAGGYSSADLNFDVVVTGC